MVTIVRERGRASLYNEPNEMIAYAKANMIDGAKSASDGTPPIGEGNRTDDDISRLYVYRVSGKRLGKWEVRTTRYAHILYPVRSSRNSTSGHN